VPPLRAGSTPRSTPPARGLLPALVDLLGGPDRIVTLADRDAAQHGVAFSPGAAGTATAALSRKP
jgi:hypothetical protein